MVPSFILPFRVLLHNAVLHLRSLAMMCDCYRELAARGTNNAALFVDEKAAAGLSECDVVDAVSAAGTASFRVKKSAVPEAGGCIGGVAAGASGVEIGIDSALLESAISAPGMMLAT